MSQDNKFPDLKVLTFEPKQDKLAAEYQESVERQVATLAEAAAVGDMQAIVTVWFNKEGQLQFGVHGEVTTSRMGLVVGYLDAIWKKAIAGSMQVEVTRT